MKEARRKGIGRRWRAIDCELEGIRDGKVVHDTDPATREGELLEELGELYYELGEDYLRERKPLIEKTYSARPPRTCEFFWGGGQENHCNAGELCYAQHYAVWVACTVWAGSLNDYRNAIADTEDRHRGRACVRYFHCQLTLLLTGPPPRPVPSQPTRTAAPVEPIIIWFERWPNNVNHASDAELSPSQAKDFARSARRPCWPN